MKNKVLIVLMLVGLPVFGQVGITGGYSLGSTFSSSKPYNSLQIGVEVPRDDESSIFCRLTASLRNYRPDSIAAYATDNVTSPPYIIVKNKIGQSYLGIEGGTRRYIGNGYDYGFSAYGGSFMNISMFTIRNQITDDFDRTKYELQSSNGTPLVKEKGRLLLLNLGLQGGVKYNFYFGMVYLDASLSYAIIGGFNNDFASTYYNGSSLFLSVNVGIRKDLFGTL